MSYVSDSKTAKKTLQQAATQTSRNPNMGYAMY